MKPPLSLIHNSADFCRWECDWISSLLADFAIDYVFDPELTVVRDRAIVVLAGNLRGQDERLIRYVRTFHERGLKVGVVHLSDEWGDGPTRFYGDADFVFRNYWRRELSAQSNCSYFPLGYKSGFSPAVTPTPVAQRRYRWCFAGHVKASRAAMLEVARRISGGVVHETTQWEDPRSLSTDAFGQMLSESVFALCPIGNRSPDTFRLYEALEAGAIPIVEEEGGSRAWAEAMSPASLWRIQPWKQRRWRQVARKALRRSYWDHAYDGGFPCPRLCHWQNLPALIDSIDIESTAARCSAWWAERKRELRAKLGRTVETTFGRSHVLNEECEPIAAASEAPTQAI